ncbi:MAG: preprotein translocase subunit SecG [Planctomycetota bacterium]|nr:preprotein translocase subunit SecG [Planctomycetota bacterium]
MIIFVRFLLGFMLVFTALFLILLVLVQRGRGGGLAGALGGMGGQSAFGAKAGDVFTKITIGVAAFWILLCIVAVNVLGRQQSLLSGDLGGAAPITVDESLDGDGGSAAAGDIEAAGSGTVETVSEEAAETPSGEDAGSEAQAEPAADGSTAEAAEAPVEATPSAE